MAYIAEFEPFIPNDIDYDQLSQIEDTIKKGESITSEEANFFLDHINYLARSMMNPNMQNFRNKCDLAQSILYYYFNSLGCKVIPNTTHGSITSQIVGHNFLVLELLVDNILTLYLVDPTYIQFFEESNCSWQKFYVSPLAPDRILLTPDPGFFIKDYQKEMAKFLLDHGYSLLTPEVGKMYGDSFYNTKVGLSRSNWKYQTMPGEIYINAFVKGSGTLSKTESQLEEENMLIKPFNLLRGK
ncbi:MAG: hypothetical protein E7167_03420 [Firmicutes bacterium]|nr:hypothetical protein [Bacillota bacterium]